MDTLSASASTCSLTDLLAPCRGITAVVGSGGKSTLLTQGARALAENGARVALATTTHMLPPAHLPLTRTVPELAEALKHTSVATIGELDRATGELSIPACGIEPLTAHADYVLVEADGSHRLPLKAHATYEPVIPSGAVRTILVVGASGFNRPIAQAVHRPAIFCELTGAVMGDIATPELVARAITAEGLVRTGADAVVINQVDNLRLLSTETDVAPGTPIIDQIDSDRALTHAQRFSHALRRLIPTPVYASSLRARTLMLLTSNKAFSMSPIH